MLAKQFRLPAGTRLISPRTISHPYFLIRFAPNHTQDRHFSVIISKKVDKRAVVRNRMRRLLHQYIQENIDLVQAGNDIIFLVQKPFAILTIHDKALLTTVLKQQGILSDDART